MTEFVLYARKPNEPDYMEDFITTQSSREALEPFIAMANSKGMTKHRIAIHKGYDKPDFVGTIRK
jgi:hypothetical protein